ncbi:hypothetical protein [Nonomuraea sp. NPDC050310]|uniref:hypothetical protein n=1 Tax=Nonomuraea sp. NPDC050310 TaxID=3154935 RepID=UPI00340BFFFC
MVVSPHWPDTALGCPATSHLTEAVTSELAACLCVADGHAEGPCHREVLTALEHGTYVWVPRHLHNEQPWIGDAGLRGGLGTVDDHHDLAQKAAPGRRRRPGAVVP